MRELETDIEKELSQLLSDAFVASIKDLSSMLNQEIEALFENVSIIEDIDAVPEILENIVVIKNNSKLGELYTVLPSSCASPLAELMMTGDTDGGAEASDVGGLKTNAIKETFSQLMDIYSKEMSKALFQNISFKVSEATYSKDLTTTKGLMEKVSKSAVILNYKVTFSRITKDVMRQVIPLELFTELLELIKPDISTSEELLAMHDPMLQQEGGPGFGDDSIMVQPVQFPSFDDQTSLQLDGNKNFNLLLDIKLKLTVELGRAELPVKRVLELTRGSIIELDKIAGEPVELFANGKLIAKGEVVVIEDNFGLRIINIVSPDDRIKNL